LIPPWCLARSVRSGELNHREILDCPAGAGTSNRYGSLDWSLDEIPFSPSTVARQGASERVGSSPGLAAAFWPIRIVEVGTAGHQPEIDDVSGGGAHDAAVLLDRLSDRGCPSDQGVCRRRLVLVRPSVSGAV